MKRKYRLTHSNDYNRVRHNGRSYAHPLTVIIVGEGQAENPRVGIQVSRALGGAVQRNRIKRQMREILTSALSEINRNCDIVVIPREPASQASFQELCSAVKVLLRRAGLIDANNNDSRG